MRCSKCGSESREGRKFCANCGAPLTVPCPKCGATNRAEERFCGECGSALTQVPAAGRKETSSITFSGERRHLTVLFCDLVGSTEISAQLDPEEWRELVATYHRAAAEAITRYGGHVAKYLGDGVMAFFGYPEAHDNDAERAARAGLAILEAVSKLNQESTKPTISVRVGIDSGAVVVGEGAGQDVDVFGEAPNVAARVQAAADPDTVLITAATYRLVSGLFVVEERGAQALRGIAQPVNLYRVIRPSGMRGRLAAAAAVRGMTPFIDREEELRLLINRWQRAREGEGQVVTIVGEAGIGKSRLMQQFRDHLATDRHTWLECAAAALFQNSPFYPIAEMLQQTFHFHTNQNVEYRLAALEASLESAGLNLNQTVPLISSLLELRTDPKYLPSSLPPDQQRRKLLAALVAWTIGFAQAQPLVMATEDLHWADPSTLELTQLLLEQGATAPLMLLYTARPEFRAQWPLRAHHTQITLNRLSAQYVRMMVSQVAAQKAITEETVNAVIERTSGVPLFVEELTRVVLESGAAKLVGREIPVTLHDSLMARLDRLGPAKEVLQIAAVIGSEFSYELLRKVHPIVEASLQDALFKLTDAELVYVRGIAPEANYFFKHALIRDAAYEALLKSRRKELHQLVARTINETFPALKDAHPEVLARHWTEAGEIESAIDEWSRAGKQANQHGAFHEAQESYQQVLSLLNLLPESPERDARELEFRQSLVSMLHVTRGWAAPETLTHAERTGILAEKSGNLRQLVGSMTLRCLHAYIAGDLLMAAALADQALELASREMNLTALANLHMMELVIRHQRGDLTGAEKYFANGLQFFEDPGFKRNPNGGVIVVFGTASCNAWLLGRADVARKRMALMRAAVNPANPHDSPWADVHAGVLYTLLRESEQTGALAVRALEICEKHKFPNEAAFCRGLLGIARAHQGRTTEGIALIRQQIADLLKMGNRITIPLYMTSLTMAEKLDGNIAAALETAEQALTFNPDEAVGRAETLRIRGELRLEQGDRHLAEADFRDSIAMARSMGARAWELRTTVSLARLLDSEGRRDEAHTMLAEIYNWFTEGFDTPDLKDAKLLLEQLGN